MKDIYLLQRRRLFYENKNKKEGKKDFEVISIDRENYEIIIRYRVLFPSNYHYNTRHIL